MKYDKYKSIDWKSVQQKYDSGVRWKDLGYSRTCLTWAVKNKLLSCRTKGESISLQYKLGNVDLSPWRTEKHRQKMSKIGGLRENSGRCRSIAHLSPIAGEVKLHGTWEKMFAVWLDENKIPWVRNKKSFPYYFGGKSRKYYPDFYLTEKNQYVEVKGYETDKDRAKWAQFNEPLLILKRKDLSSPPYNFWSCSSVARASG